MNPERAAINNIDRELRADSIERATEKLLGSYPRVHEYIEKVAIKPESLRDYDPATIANDQKHVARMKQKMLDNDLNLEIGNLNGVETKQLADILEYQVFRGINEGGWIPFCRAIKTSEYDDIVNGVDLVVEYSNKEQIGHLGLALDVSFSQNLSRKFERVKYEIDNYDGEKNRLAEVKYFTSEKSGISGRLFGIPRVVAAMDTPVMVDLAKDLARGKGPNPEHAIRHSLLIEMEHQLETYKKYAEKHNSKCVPQLFRAWAFVKVINEKLESEKKLHDSEYHKNDKLQKAIDDGLRIFK